MKTHILNASIVLSALFMTLSFSSCSNDTNGYEPEEHTRTDSALVGSWQRVESRTDSDERLITFSEDGTWFQTDCELRGNTLTTTWKKGTWASNSSKSTVSMTVTAGTYVSERGTKATYSYTVNPSGMVLDGETFKSID